MSQENSCNKMVNQVNYQMMAKLSQYFLQYMTNMFNDLSIIVGKKLAEQQKKIRNNQQRLITISQAIGSRSHCSSTSLGDKEMAKPAVLNEQMNKLSFCNLKDAQKINQILKKIELNISYLQRSLNQLKTRKEIQDPQTLLPQKSRQTIKLSQKEQTETTIASKIQKLSSKITKLAKESSIEDIQKQSSFLLKKHLPKSKSLVSISCRKYHPVSCPKRYQYGLTLKKFPSESQLLVKSPQHENLIPNFKSEIMLKDYDLDSKNDENKMPLINRVKSVLNQLLLNCKDGSDANVVKFHLKKTFQKVDEMFKKKKRNQANVFCELNENDVNRHCIKDIVPEYFAGKGNRSFQKPQKHDKNDQSQCLITGNLSSSNNLSWVKQNYSAYNSKLLNNNQNSNENNQSQQQTSVKDSRQKRKYFQRTSNDQKITMLKKRLKPDGGK